MNFPWQPPTAEDSLRWHRHAGRDIVPLWIADTDFPAPPAVVDALRQRIDSGLFGYGQPMPSQVEAVVAHCAETYAWSIEPEWLVWLPGLVPALHVACRTVGAAGDGVVAATPVYPPFLDAPVKSSRQLLTVPLQREARAEGRWCWDFEATAAAMRAARLLLLCHPHNPVGRAWDDDELERLAALARTHDLVVCSDEIHCDLILDDRKHRPFAMLGKDAARRSITLMAPSKTFNLPGLGCAFAIIPDAGLRQAFLRTLSGIVPHVNVLGLVACEAALRHGGAWRQDLLATLRTHRQRVETTVAGLPGLSMAHVEASYLAWIDARGLGLQNPHRHFESHGLGLSDGRDFGAPGWVRLNFGCQEKTLDEALRRLASGATAAGS